MGIVTPSKAIGEVVAGLPPGAAAADLATWLEASRHGIIEPRPDGPARDGGDWQGPTTAAWTKRLLRGALPPRESTGGGASILGPHG